jgi:hypothetical protein
MLSKPNFGWSTLQIGDFYDDVSYLTDVPLDCLESMIRALKYHIPFVVQFDTEGSYIILTSCDYIYTTTVTYWNNDGIQIKEFNIGLIELAKDLYNDINSNINDWSMFSSFCEPNTVESKEYKEKLIRLLEELNMLIMKGED